MKKGEKIKPRLIAFEVTRRCRFSCRHCRADASCIGTEEELSTEQWRRIVASVAKFTIGTGRSKARKRTMAPIIIFTGGEPMERSDIYQLIRYAGKLGLRPVLATCGYLVNDESILELKQAGISALSFSLDGASAESNDAFRQSKGAFDSTIRAAELARRSRIRFQVNATISKLNIGEVIGMAELAKRLGAYCFNPFILVPTGRGREIADLIIDPVEYETLLNELLNMKVNSKMKLRVTCGPQFARVCRQSRYKRLIGNVNGCMGGRGFGFISYRGDVQICGFLDISAGNLIENDYDFSRIWLESEFLKEVRDLSGYRGNCRICEFGGLCGGCRARAFAMSGDYLAGDPVCGYQPRSKD